MSLYASDIFSPVTGPGGGIGRPVVYFDDFTDGWGFEGNDADNTGKFSETANLGQWLVTVVDGDTDNGETIVCSDDAAGGHLAITTNDKDNDSVEMQLNGEAFKWSPGTRGLIEVRLKGADVSEFDWFVGLAITDTTVMAGATDRIGFECPDSTGDIDAISELNSSQTTTDTTSDVADNTFVTLRVEYNGTSAKYFVDGTLKATHTTNIPTDEALTPTVCIRNDGAAANTLTLDYFLAMCERP